MSMHVTLLVTEILRQYQNFRNITRIFIYALKRNHYTTRTALAVVNISATWTSCFGDGGAVGSVDVCCSARRGCRGRGFESLARIKIFSASIGSVDSLYLSMFIYCANLHQSHAKAMMFVKSYFRTSDFI